MPTHPRTLCLLFCSGMLLGIPACQSPASPAGLLDGHRQIDSSRLAATDGAGEQGANAPRDDGSGSSIELASFELPQRPSVHQPAADQDEFVLPLRTGAIKSSQ